MNILSDKSLDLQALQLKIENQIYPIFTLDLALTVNNMPVCNVSLSAASGADIKIDQECEVSLVHSKGTDILFNGYIMADSVNVATYPTHIENYRTYAIAISTSMIDAIPPTAWVYLTNATGGENLVVMGITKVGKSAYGLTNKTTSADNNISKLILGALDKLSDDIKNNNSGTSSNDISKHFAPSELLLNTTSIPETVVQHIDKRVRSLILGGAPYMQVIQTLCSDFYLSLLPVVDNKQYKMQIAHIDAWGKSERDIKLSEYTSAYTSQSSIKNRNIDGVLMPIYDTSGKAVTDTGLFTFYGQKVKNGNMIHEIVDIKSAGKFFGQDTGSLRYKQIQLPSWLVGNAPDTLRNNAKRVVKEYFATYAYANYQLSMNIPYFVYRDLKQYLGKVVSVETLGGAADFDNIGKSARKKFKGVIHSLNLGMRFVASKLDVSCYMTLSHVRPEDVDKQFKFTDSDRLYK